MLQKRRQQAKNILNHQIKDIGTFMSGIYALIIGSVLLTVDYNIYFGLNLYINEVEIYSRLISVSNVLISILIGISLTTFSVIFVVMQLASSQFSPRILRHFLSNDIKMQKFIGLFVGTISLCVLPQLASVFFYKTPFLLTLSVGSLLAFYCLTWSYPTMITYLSVNMNVSSITNRIKTEMIGEINVLYQENWSIGKKLLYKRSKINPDKFQIKIVSPFETGYLDSVNYKKLERLSAYILNSDVGLQFENAYQKPIVGEFIMKDTTTLLVLVFSEEIKPSQVISLKKEVGVIVRDAFRVELFRSHTQDVNFGVRKLVDIAIKAISPAVNDPTTCLNCIDQIGEIAKELAIREFPSTDSRTLGSKKIQVNEFNFEEFIDFCYDQIFQWGKEDPTVVKRIIRSIRIILPLVENPFNLKILIQQVEEMDLLEIYNLSNYKNGKLKISKEKLVTVEIELSKFRQKAKLQIKVLELKGVLDHYEANHYSDNLEIINAEIEAIKYLKAYKIFDESVYENGNELT
ncbi:DUF2254 family protein [Flavobacterium xinjiangense]|uniref:Uncharacterized membrane protein n=1 Tax=Flavobacterium xinjiangense TaxID=178356 RepID=A0A1M7NGQ2_9FLAO|nr:DUF2254 family protein [Flavobacterium xinjiangense]SHN03001.1 Uncharacterized membrane protein [Flavobacterium xinjiangense]